jgi:DNA-binding XRE family transcriptional regulator
MNKDFDMAMFTPRQARHLSGLSVQKVADKLGINSVTYFNKEKGKTRFYVDEAILFAHIVGVPFKNIKW